MPVINHAIVVPYTAEQMFVLVNDIARYEKFLPWCQQSVVHEKSDKAIQATLTFCAQGITQSFTTRNILQDNAMKMELVAGPFKSLQGFWQFKKCDDNSCEVTLHLSFELSNWIMSKMLRPLIQPVSSKMMNAFVVRAREIYGENNDSDHSCLRSGS